MSEGTPSLLMNFSNAVRAFRPLNELYQRWETQRPTLKGYHVRKPEQKVCYDAGGCLQTK